MSSPRTYVSLDGIWTLACDPDNVGVAEAWYDKPPAGVEDLQLPTMSSQEIAARGGVGWYFKTFDFDESWQGRTISLLIGSLTCAAAVWLNGARLGEHPGGGTPAEFPLSDALRPGQNLLAIQMLLIEPGGEAPVVSPSYYPLDAPADVALHVLPPTHIEGIYIQPDIRRKRVRVEVQAPSGTTIHLQIEGTDCRAEGAPGELTLEFPEFECWGPGTPVLYRLRADLIADDGTVDSLSIPFGMREFTVKDERFYLNNRPIYIKSIDYVPQYPQNLRADKLGLLLKRELLMLKDGGFNTLRVCGAPAPSALFDLADEIGVLVFAEVATPPQTGASSSGASIAARQVRRDRNRPSLVAWCGVHPPRPDAAPSQAMAESYALAVRGLDPSRLILCDTDSGAGHGGESAELFRPYRDTPERYECLETAIVAPVGQLARDYLRLSGDPERLNFQGGLSVGGCTGWADGSASGRAQQAAFDAAFTSRQLERCFGAPEKFYEASQIMQANGLRAQLDAVRTNVKMMGYGVGSLCDGPATTPFGLSDIKRQAKPVLKGLDQVQQEVRPVIQMYKTNLVPREEVGVTILLINESRLEGRGELSLQVVGPTNQVLWKKKRLVKIPRHGRELWSGEIAASGSPGPHKFVVRLLQDRRVIGENAVDMHVVQPLKAEPVEVNVLGDVPRWRSACGRLAKLQNFLAPIHIVPPLANTIRAYPAAELVQVLAQAYEGAVAIIFGPPDDWNDLAELVGAGLKIDTRVIAGGTRVNHHYAKTHPIFEGLPSRDLMRQPYQNILALKAIEGETDEEMTGVHSVWRDSESDATLQHWWGTNITVRRLGAGRVVFTHLRILENLGSDPVADRLFANLLQHFSLRSIPGTEKVGTDQKVVEWLRRERNTGVRKWMLIGAFPNWNGRTGHDTQYPPETTIDLDATYPGWYRALRWKPWNTKVTGRHTIDFTAALDSDVGTGAPCPYGTAYAYAEFSCDRRDEVSLTLKGEALLSVWLNGSLLHTSLADEIVREEYVSIVHWVKQGKNTLLIKCSKRPGPFRVSVDIQTTGAVPLVLNWWK